VDLSNEIREELDELYAIETGIAKKDLDKWKASHIPFHWFIEFPEALTAGGFDAVIGNPPYINRHKVTQYSFSGFKSEFSNDIFAPCMERAVSIVKPDGAFSMIVPIAFQFSKDYEIIREVIAERTPARWVSTYSRNPASLFDAAVGVRSTIVLSHHLTASRLATSSLRRWQEDGRRNLFETTRYAVLEEVSARMPWPRTGTTALAELYKSLCESSENLGYSTVRIGDSIGFKQTALYYLSVFVDEPPSWTMKGKRIPQSQIGNLSFRSEAERDIAFIMLAGRLGVWWWGATGDDFHVTNGSLEAFPISIGQLGEIHSELLRCSRKLRKEQLKHPLVTKYAGNEMGNYDMSRCRHITDVSDRMILEFLGLGQYWPDVLLADAGLAKVTGERPGTRRSWPFPI
jgi:hypothetical protein